HGALLDSELLAEVYTELIVGKQASLGLELAAERSVSPTGIVVSLDMQVRQVTLAPRLSKEDRASSAGMVAAMGDNAMWLKWRGRAAERTSAPLEARA